MKKNLIRLPVKLFLPVIMGVFIVSCASNDTNPPGSSDTTGTDTSMMVNTDTMMSDHTEVVPVDTSAGTGSTLSDSMSRVPRDTSVRLRLDKKAKKGKVSILAADNKPNTTAMEMDKEGYYRNTEILPGFPGGQKALERFFEDNIVYPEAATENGSAGTVKLTFAVDENGKVYNPVAAGNPIGDGIEEEAIRVFKKMPAWTPGRIKGKNVKTRYTLPISFRLD